MRTSPTGADSLPYLTGFLIFRGAESHAKPLSPGLDRLPATLWPSARFPCIGWKKGYPKGRSATIDLCHHAAYRNGCRARSHWQSAYPGILAKRRSYRRQRRYRLLQNLSYRTRSRQWSPDRDPGLDQRRRFDRRSAGPVGCGFRPLRCSSYW